MLAPLWVFSLWKFKKESGGRKIKSLRKGRVHSVYSLFFAQNLPSEMHQEEHKTKQQTKEKRQDPQLVPETRTAHRQQLGEVRVAATAATVLSSGNRGCCPETACCEPCAQQSAARFSGLPQMNFPTCIHREGLGKEMSGKLKPKHAN